MLLLCVPVALSLGACKGKEKTKDSAAAGDLGSGLSPAVEAKAGPAGHDEEPHDGGHEKSASTGHRDGGHGEQGEHAEDDIEATYTPRRLAIDEEECDDAARDALSRLRAQAQRLSDRAHALSQREQALRERERAQGEAAQKIEAQVAELRKLNAELLSAPERAQREKAKAEAEQAAQQAATARAEQKERVQRVTKMIGGMPPQRAASMLGAMADDALAAEVLEGLPQETAGKVLAQMRPESAARLAGRIGGTAILPDKVGKATDKATDKVMDKAMDKAMDKDRAVTRPRAAEPGEKEGAP